MQYLKADTVTEVLIGPVVAVGDGFTPVTSLTIAGADEAEIIKHGATTVTAITGTLAAITNADGYYALDLVTGDVDTEGRLTILINDDSLCLPVRHDFMVVNANVFDSLFAAAATDYLQVDTTQWIGTACATPTVNGVPEVDLTHVAGATTNVSVLATNVDAILTDTAVIGSTGQGLTSLATQASVNTVDTVVDTIAVDVAGLDGAAMRGTDSAYTGTPPTAASIADAVWDEAATGHTDAGKAGEQLWTDVDAILVDTAEIGAAGAGLTNINLPDQTMNITGSLSGSVGSITGAVGSVTGNVGGNVVGSVGSLVANAIDNSSLHSNACAKISDSGIQRGASNWENNSDPRSLGWAISKLVNKVDIDGAGNTLSIRKSDDSTALFTQAITTSGGAAPVVGLDTA